MALYVFVRSHSARPRIRKNIVASWRRSGRERERASAGTKWFPLEPVISVPGLSGFVFSPSSTMLRRTAVDTDEFMEAFQLRVDQLAWNDANAIYLLVKMCQQMDVSQLECACVYVQYRLATNPIGSKLVVAYLLDALCKKVESFVKHVAPHELEMLLAACVALVPLRDHELWVAVVSSWQRKEMFPKEMLDNLCRRMDESLQNRTHPVDCSTHSSQLRWLARVLYEQLFIADTPSDVAVVRVCDDVVVLHYLISLWKQRTHRVVLPETFSAMEQLLVLRPNPMIAMDNLSSVFTFFQHQHHP